MPPSMPPSTVLPTKPSEVAAMEKSNRKPGKPHTEGCHDAIPELLLRNNQLWASAVQTNKPGFFEQCALGQDPKVFWIGCADARVPANEVVGLGPNKMFVHRNIANMVPASDINVLSVIQYAVEHLKVEHIIVCGHTGCGGVAAALSNKSFGGLLDAWLRQIKVVYAANKAKLDAITDEKARVSAMVELNVAANVSNVAASSAVQEAWAKGQKLSIHGWVYQLDSGLLKDLEICVDGPYQVDAIYRP